MRQGMGAGSHAPFGAAVPQHKGSPQAAPRKKGTAQGPPPPAPRRRGLQCTGERGYGAGSAEPSPRTAHGPTRGQRFPQPGGCCGAGGKPTSGPPGQRGPRGPWRVLRTRGVPRRHPTGVADTCGEGTGNPPNRRAHSPGKHTTSWSTELVIFKKKIHQHGCSSLRMSKAAHRKGRGAKIINARGG